MELVIATLNIMDVQGTAMSYKGSENARNPSKTITFRIDEKIISKLIIESSKRDISLNSFVNQIFRNFLNWDMLQSQAGMIPVAKPVIAEIFERMRKEDVIDLAKRVGKHTMYDMVLFMKKSRNLEDFLSWLEIWAKKNSTAGFSRSKEDGVHICVMKHDLGENWSLYHKIVLEEVFNDVLRKPLKVTVNSSSLVFEINEL